MWSKGSRRNGKFVCGFNSCAYHSAAVKRNKCSRYDKAEGDDCFTTSYRRPLKSAVAAHSRRPK